MTAVDAPAPPTTEPAEPDRTHDRTFLGWAAFLVALAAIVSHAGLPLEGQALVVAGTAVLNFAMVLIMYRFLTSKTVSWSMIWRGAALCGVLYTALQLVGTLVMTRAFDNAEAVYGAFAGTLALLTWLTLLAYISLIGGELNAALDRRRHRIAS